jgi:hypothetical protein
MSLHSAKGPRNKGLLGAIRNNQFKALVILAALLAVATIAVPLGLMELVKGTPARTSQHDGSRLGEGLPARNASAIESGTSGPTRLSQASVQRSLASAAGNPLSPAGQAQVASAALGAAQSALFSGLLDPQRLLPPPNNAPPGLIAIPGSNLPDPFVLTVHGTYYLYASQASLYYFGTHTATPNLPVLWGPSLTDLGSVHDAMPVMPAWAETGWDWAPDVRRLGPHDYVMWFSALIKNHSPLLQKCIGAATSTSPKGPFYGQPKPLVCQLSQDGSIDPRSYLTKSGQLWLVWKSDNNADVNGTSHTFIYVQQLASNGLSFIGPRYRILTANQPWEGRIVEAPQMVHTDGAYWLFYSGNWFNQSDYAIGVAECLALTGPCFKPFDRPLVKSGPLGPGPGEESLFYANGSWWMVYGPWDVNYRRRRPVAILQVHFGPWGPYFTRPTMSQIP